VNINGPNKRAKNYPERRLYGIWNMFGARRKLTDQWLWLLLVIGVAVVSVAVILVGRKKERTKEDNAVLTLGLTLVVLGIIFGDDRLIGYSFIGVGVLLSIISAIRSRTK
jgi:hypothetical protein